MKIIARAARKWTGYSHTVVSQQAELRDVSAEKNGTVKFWIRSSELGLSGRFNFYFEIPIDEMDKLHRAAENGALIARIEELEVEVARLKSS